MNLKKKLRKARSNKVMENYHVALVAGQSITHLAANTSERAFWDIASILKSLSALAGERLILSGQMKEGEFLCGTTPWACYNYRAFIPGLPWMYTQASIEGRGVAISRVPKYNNLQGHLLAKMVMAKSWSGDLKTAILRILPEIKGGFSFCPLSESRLGEIVPGTPYLIGVPHDPLARYMIVNGEAPLHAGAFARVDFLASMARMLWESKTGKKYYNRIKKGGYIVNQKLGLVFSAFGKRIEGKEFTGQKEFDREFVAFTGASGPSIYIWPQKKVAVIIMINSAYYPDPFSRRGLDVFSLRRDIVREVISSIWSPSQENTTAFFGRRFFYLLFYEFKYI